MPFIIFENCYDLWLKVRQEDIDKLKQKIAEILSLPDINHIQIWQGTENYQDIGNQYKEIGTIVKIKLFEGRGMHQKIQIAIAISLFLLKYEDTNNSWIFFEEYLSDCFFFGGKILGQKPENPTIPPGNGFSVNPDDGSF